MLLRWIERFKIFFRLLLNSLKAWSFGDWFAFWLSSNRSKVTLHDYTMNIRTETFTNKLSDVMIVFEVLHDGEYEMCPIYPDDIIVDIGGHIGSFSIMASRKAHRGKIFTYEAFEGTFRQLQKNLAENRVSNVQPQNIAIADKVGEMTFFVNTMNQAQNSLYAETGEKHIVKTIPLQNVFSDNGISRCNLMKVDCEGAEYDILFSGKDALQNVERIILEYHEPTETQLAKGYNPQSLEKLLKDSGFQVNTVQNNHYRGVMYGERPKAA
jgi:FkbM family methyltransferase